MHHRGICHESLGAARLLLVAMAVLLGLGLMPGKATAQQASDQATAEVPQAQDHLMAAAPLNPLDCFNVTATVSLSGGSLEAGEFTFRLTDSAGSAMEATNQHSDLTGQNNYVNFEIPYGQVGTRTYRLVQENNPRYRCDTTVYEVTVTVTQDMLGNKGASVTYSTGGKTVSQAAFSNGPLPPPSGQWVHEDGVTRYRTPQGAYASGWCTIDGQTYYFDTSGAHGRRTGWLQQGGTWYFLSPADGHRETGWIREGGRLVLPQPFHRRHGYRLGVGQRRVVLPHRLGRHGCRLGIHGRPVVLPALIGSHGHRLDLDGWRLVLPGAWRRPYVSGLGFHQWQLVLLRSLQRRHEDRLDLGWGLVLPLQLWRHGS